MQKPAKPYPEFPLFPHASGQWAKKINGKLVYFGVWSDWQSALDKYLKQRDRLQAGLPRESDGTATVRDMVNRWLNDKGHLVETGDLSPRTFATYRATGARLARMLPPDLSLSAVTPADFARIRTALSQTRGPVALGNEIQRIRSAFIHAHQCGMLAVVPQFGPTFRKPSKKTIRRHRRQSPAKAFEPGEILRMLMEAPQPLRAMIWLAINCGFGQNDVASLPLSAIDFASGWIDFARPKTETHRRCPLWPETARAIQDAIAVRPEPRTAREAGLVFVTRYGLAWTRVTTNGTPDDAVSKEFSKLLRRLDLVRRGRNFYALRHCFESAGGEARDQVAVDCLMGHIDSSMAGHYREWISDARLIAVTDAVRRWLLSPLDVSQLDIFGHTLGTVRKILLVSP